MSEQLVTILVELKHVRLLLLDREKLLLDVDRSKTRDHIMALNFQLEMLRAALVVGNHSSALQTTSRIGKLGWHKAIYRRPDQETAQHATDDRQRLIEHWKRVALSVINYCRAALLLASNSSAAGNESVVSVAAPVVVAAAANTCSVQTPVPAPPQREATATTAAKRPLTHNLVEPPPAMIVAQAPQERPTARRRLLQARDLSPPVSPRLQMPVTRIVDKTPAPAQGDSPYRPPKAIGAETRHIVPWQNE